MIPTDLGESLIMPELQKSIASPLAATPSSRKLLRLLGKRLRQLGWALLGLAAATCVFAIWWLTSLRRLPDIGDPFDLSAILDPAVPDDRNAFTFLCRAHKALTPLPELPNDAKKLSRSVGWTQADPKLREWVEANGPALALFQDAASQSDGTWTSDGWPFWQRCRDGWWNYRIFAPGGLIPLALLEGDRRLRADDPAGAWECHRAVLRMTTHLRRRGSLTIRFQVNQAHVILRQRLADWSADPRTSIALLKEAIDEALESQPRPEWDALSLKLEYLELMRFLEQSSNPNHQAIDEGLTYHIAGLEIPTDLSMYVFAGERFLSRESERSRRALRLLFANWLAHVEVPDLRADQPAVRAVFGTMKEPINLALYPVNPRAAAGARVLRPLELAGWIVTIIDARPFLYGWLWPSVRDQERRGYRDLVVSLAAELYHREHGSLPPSDEALVGTYLKALPDDGAAELDDGTTAVLDARCPYGQP